MMKQRIRLSVMICVSLIAVVLMSAPVSADLLGHEIGTVSATAGTELGGGAYAIDAVNGNGLTVSTMQHDMQIFGHNMYVSAAGGSTALDIHPAGIANTEYADWLRIDFDQLYSIDTMTVWNLNQDGIYVDNNRYNATNRGYRNISIDYTSDGTNWIHLGDYELAQALGLDSGYPDGLIDPTMELSLGGIEFSSIVITAEDNWGDPSYYGLSEVLFDGTVPEPATMVLLGLGGLVLRRRKQKRSA